MTDQEILSRLTRILRELLSDDSIVLTMETKRDEVPNWDSFAYVNFIVAVEMEFGVKFRVADVESFQNVGAVVQAISAVVPTRLQRARGGAA
jgi:acyl carrier protein